MLHVGEARISRRNAFNRRRLCGLSEAWKNIQPLLADRNLDNGARIVLANWRGDQPVRHYANWKELAKAIKLELGRREKVRSAATKVELYDGASSIEKFADDLYLA